MGTTLTGTTPQDTYDSLIKVTDNGPLSGSLKTLTDGLGNDSALALSTGSARVTGPLTLTSATAQLIVTNGADSDSGSFTGVIIGGSNAANARSASIIKNTSSPYDLTIRSQNATGVTTGSMFFQNGSTTQMTITDTGNVGIGTSAPSSKLHLSGASAIFQVTDTNKATNNSLHISAVSQTVWGIGTDTSGTFTGTKLAITDAGNVGIGTSSPYSASGFTSLDINGTNGSLLLLRTSGTTNLSIGTSSGNPTIKAEAGKSLGFYTDATQVANITPNGITFGADTAAANALDDYEEGTFTATLKGSGSDPSTPVTTTANYTKIGRQVTVSLSFVNVNTTGASGSVSVSGLPFTIGSASIGAALTEFFDFGAGRTSVCSLAGAGASIINFVATGDDAAFDNLTHSAGTGRYLYTTITYNV